MMYIPVKLLKILPLMLISDKATEEPHLKAQCLTWPGVHWGETTEYYT